MGFRERCKVPSFIWNLGGYILAIVFLPLAFLLFHSVGDLLGLLFKNVDNFQGL